MTDMPAPPFYSDDAVTIWHGNALDLPLEDESVDLVVTSPPYFGLRAYSDGGETYSGQIGSEATPGEFLDALAAATREMVRVLKPSGSIFVNLGDKYNSAASGQQSSLAEWSEKNARGGGGKPAKATPGRGRQVGGVPTKSLMLLPERYRIRCVDDLGLIARAVIVWAKPNGLPESVRDRVRRSHEDWVHLTKEPRYFTGIDEIREEYSENKPWGSAALSGRKPGAATAAMRGHRPDQHQTGLSRHTENPLGKLPGSVWTIPTQPLRVPPELGIDHFACVDTDTEILTRRGWLRHDEVRVGDEAAGYDLDTQRAKWTPISALHSYPFDGELVSVEKRDLSMRLTANHRTLVVRAGKEQIVRADEVRATDAIPRATLWEPEEPREGIGETVAALCGWIAAEGWYQPTGNVHLSQSASVNADKVAAIDKLLRDAPQMPRAAGSRGISFERGAYRARLKHQGRRVNLGSFPTHDDAAESLRLERERLGIDGLQRTEATRVWKGREWIDVTWRLPRGFGEYIRRLMPNKLLTADLANLPLNEARALFEAFVDGDGHRRPDGLSAAGRISIYQKVRTNLDWLQVIAVRLGYRTLLTQEDNRFVLYCNEARRPLTLRGTNGTTAPIPRERYTGTVWCPTTGTGTMIARRNGRVFITGQSYPMEWPRRIIRGWSPSGICVDCGEGRRPVAVETPDDRKAYRTIGLGDPRRDGGTQNRLPKVLREDGTGGDLPRKMRALTGYACACDAPTAPTRPAVILDPFGGTGTTGVVAKALGRRAHLVDLSRDYCRLAQWRVNDPKELAKAGQVKAAKKAKVTKMRPKPPEAEQGSLLDDPAA